MKVNAATRHARSKRAWQGGRCAIGVGVAASPRTTSMSLDTSKPADPTLIADDRVGHRCAHCGHVIAGDDPSAVRVAAQRHHAEQHARE